MISFLQICNFIPILLLFKKAFEFLPSKEAKLLHDDYLKNNPNSLFEDVLDNALQSSLRFQVGEKAPKFTLRNVDDQSSYTFIEKGHRDKVYCLYFWATWCAPCVKKITELQAIINKQPNIKFIFIALESDIDKLKKYIDEKRGDLPEGLSIDYVFDVSFHLRGRLNMMLSNLAMGAVLVAVVLGLFLNLQVAGWVMLGIPVSFLGALWLMPITPYNVNINVLSLFAFIMVLGIVVDDAIVIGESIFSEAIDEADKGAAEAR